MKKINKNLATFIAILSSIVGFTTFAFAATPVNLGSLSNFAVVGGSTVTNTGSSVINGDLGLSPGSSVVGFPPGTLNGTQHISDTVANQAEVDLANAYSLAGQPTVSTVPTELAGRTLPAGVYDSTSGTFGISGVLTLDAQGDANAVFIFKTSSTLITGGASNVVLANGAQACNVFWQVGSSATLGANSTFKGNILALSSVTLTTGANVEGRVLARNGAVTLDGNTVTKATCAVPPTPAPIPAFVTTPTTSAIPTTALTAPLISIKKIPTPLALPNGAGTVVYDYSVLNVGTVPMTNIVVTDNKCSSVGFISSDLNNNASLDVGETWKYRCTMTLSQTTTNSATVTGQANGFTAIDTANATVVVGTQVAPPLIHIVKKPNVFVLPFSGGPVTYLYAVTNLSSVPLNSVSVIDNKCFPVLGHTGDLNNNNLLESSEIWTYTCQGNLQTTVTNTAIAEGSASGLTALDYALATVVVAPAPQLPQAGFPPKESGDLLTFIIIAIGGLSGAIISTRLIKKSQTN